MATDENKCTGVQVLDPVQGFVDYVQDIKPFHTKIVEVLIEYVYSELLDIRITDEMHLHVEIDRPAPDVFGPAWCNEGYSLLPFGNPHRWPILSPNQAISMEDYPAIDPGTNTIRLPGDRSDNLRIGDRIQIISQIENWTHPDYGTDVYTPTPGLHTGFYTITNLEFVPEQTDTWPGYPLPNFPDYLIGDEMHTIVTVAEPLVAIPALGATQAYVAFIIQESVEMEGVLSYSNAEETYDALTPSLLSNPDEGWTRKSIVSTVVSTLDPFNQPLPGSGAVTVKGDISGSNVFEGDKLSIFQSSDNNGTFTITNITYDNVADETTFYVFEYIRSAVPDGYVRVDVPSNVFVVDGDHTARFVQGFEFNVVGGSLAGRYTTLNSRVVDQKTRIRPTADILDWGTGYKIIDSVAPGLIVPSNTTSKFPPGTQVNIVGSPQNDGEYEVVNSNYDVANRQTSIELNPSPAVYEAGGEMHPVVMGMIADVTYGFGEGPEMCNHLPETRVHVVFKEHLVFDGIGIALRDDLIVYNMENSDPGGYEMPIATRVSEFPPMIPESVLPPPVSPGIDVNEFWLDESSGPGTLRRWTGQYWQPIQTAYWLERDTRLLHYRTITRNASTSVDTGWVLMLAHPPGFNDTQPAIGQVHLVGRESFLDDGSTTFEFAAPSFMIVDSQDNVASADAIIIEGDVRSQLGGVDLSTGNRQVEVLGAGLGDGTYTIIQYNYRSDTDETWLYIEEPLAFILSTGTATVVPLMIPGMDQEMVKVYVNDVPAAINILSPTQFEILSPYHGIGDKIRAEVFAATRPETNANVNPFDLVPHRVLHERVDTTPAHFDQSYTLYGGNYIHRMIPTNRLEIYDYDGPGVVDIQHPRTFSVVGTDLPTNTITIEGVYDWFFSPGVVMAVRTSLGTLDEYTVASSAAVGPLTVITVVEDVKGKPSTVADHHFERLILDIYEIDDVTDTIVLEGNYVDAIRSTLPLRVSGTMVAPNELIEYTVNSVVYSPVNGRTLIAVDQDIPVPTPPLTLTYTIVDVAANYIVVNGNIRLDAMGDDLVERYQQADIINTVDEYNDGRYRVRSVDYDPIADQSRIHLVQPIPSVVASIDDVSGEIVLQAMGRLHVAVFEEYHHVLGAVFDPVVDVSQPDQVKTYVIPTTPPHLPVDALAYAWYSPLQMSVASEPRNELRGIIRDRHSMSDEFDYDDPTHGRPDDQLVESSIVDELTFGWGQSEHWDIIATDVANDTITVAGDITGILDVGDSGSIINAQDIAGDYDVVSWTTNGVSTTITLTPSLGPLDPPLAIMGYFQLENIDATEWYQFRIREANSTTNTFTINGNATADVMPGAEFRVFGTSNDDLYQAITVSAYDPAENITEIVVANITNDDNGGWIESYRDFGINLVLEDLIGVAVDEEANSALVLTSGALADGFDYTYFDVGALDEDIVTVRQLHGTKLP